MGLRKRGWGKSEAVLDGGVGEDFHEEVPFYFRPERQELTM